MLVLTTVFHQRVGKYQWPGIRTLRVTWRAIKVYVGTAPGVYGPPTDVGNATTAKVTNLTNGQTLFFAVTAYNTAGQESGFSNEVSKLIN